MSKELEALKRMEYFVNEEMGIKTFKQSGWHIEGTDDYQLVKEGLERLEAIDNANPSKALEYVNGKIADLEDDLQHYTMVEKDKCKEFFIREDLKQFTIIKQYILKAQELEKLLNAIIKKNVNVWRFKADADIDYEYYKSNSILYHDVVHNNLLTEEEFNSLVTFISNLFQ